MTMMGGPIDARKSPTAVNNLAMNKSYAWFENNVIYRVPANYPGAGRARLPRLPAARRLHRDEPGPPPASRTTTTSWTWCAATTTSAESHREFYDEYNAVLDMPAEYYLDTIKTVFQDFALVNGTWDVIRRRARRVRRRTSRPPRC